MAMTLRLTDEQDHALTLLASAQGTSKHEAVVRAIVAAAARTLADAHVQ
ncbi:CopG family transcriptional regulator, partial [Corynebacterium sp.]